MGAAAQSRVWVAPPAGEDQYCIAVLTHDAIYASPTPPDNPNIEARLAAGEAPQKTLGEKARRVPLSAIRQVELNRRRCELTIDAISGDAGPTVIVLADALQVGEAFAALRERLGEGWTHDTPRQSIGNALKPPCQLLLLSAGVPLIMVAVGLLGGEMAGKRSLSDFLITLYAVVMIVLAVLGWIYLGPGWVLGIAGALFLAWLAWAAVCVVRRPDLERLTRS